MFRTKMLPSQVKVLSLALVSVGVSLAGPGCGKEKADWLSNDKESKNSPASNNGAGQTSASGTGGGNNGTGTGGQATSVGGSPSSATLPAATVAAFKSFGLGEVVFQKLQVKKGVPVQANFNSNPKSSSLVSDEDAFQLAGEGASSSALEVSILKADGTEVSYKRSSPDADLNVNMLPKEDGEILIAIKNNGKSEVEIEPQAMTGATQTGELVRAVDDPQAKYKNVVLKAVVVFARTCKQTTADGNSTTTHTAPAGEAYVQPFVFLGKVDAARKVSLVSGAQIKVKAGSKEMSLQTLSQMPFKAYREVSSLNEAEHQAYTRMFYQGYFGAGGELYTVDTFRKNGDCQAMPTLPLSSDLGKSEVQLQVVESSLGLSETFRIRPTASTAFSTYENSDVKLTDYTQCTYNRTTGEPKTYNGDASQCKRFSLANPPWVKLDYKLPSQSGENAAYSAESDPTRILFYGHSYPKAWYSTLIAQSAALRAGTSKEVALESCLNNGGLVSVPLEAAKTVMPLGEFNAKVGDVVNLARRTGSYTGLPQFYQGNIDASGVVKVPTCIPDGSQSCADYKVLDVALKSCVLKADSGIAATSLSDSFIYPDYFEMSGVIEE